MQRILAKNAEEMRVGMNVYQIKMEGAKAQLGSLLPSLGSANDNQIKAKLSIALLHSRLKDRMRRLCCACMIASKFCLFTDRL